VFSEYRESAEIGGQKLNRMEAGFVRDAMVQELASLRDLLRSPKEKAAQSGPRGEPLLPGTEIPIHSVAALVELMANGRLDLSAAEAAFPKLTRDQILTAFRHSRACPVRGAAHPADRLMTRIDRMERMLVSDQL
jgi:uncharacterized protein (DUF433 family)